MTEIELATIEVIAGDLSVDPSFIEKDWYSMRLIAELLTINNPNFRLVFSGGTSLSKGCGLIKRFSEDIDFKVIALTPSNRNKRGQYRDQIVEAIRLIDLDCSLNEDDIVSKNENHFFQFTINYSSQFTLSTALRPYIKVEITIVSDEFTYEEKSLQSFLSQALDNQPEVLSIPCVSPLETAADKLSALTWRVLEREAGGTKYHPTDIRHLHDLAALENIIVTNKIFSDLIFPALENDATRAKKINLTEIQPLERLQRASLCLKNNPIYEQEYQSFVIAMSYAAEDEKLSFEKALSRLDNIINSLNNIV
ncbi:hypothetical protein DSM106972_068850 [Dulcicalothrix desertica PCC 7102]|uniref:Nucleotidyltransferase n=1 Tax=Dulcicalothrix desertica PCC 7102 TaxID=232991 RepID=A0A3S1D0G9_9CYAN|nr:nucleotidyl transferase AbiEii/AbiGii toxin family protein [Dulcicalothrix desertica]RUT01334.1 hypothetical protein DSM106972_068850 [Dulcicalothrix desertica PCC 7102]TWH40518.1 hypothetical protein CAL7102_09858 [Dulcicalothrix desertica PCC 7102]